MKPIHIRLFGMVAFIVAAITLQAMNANNAIVWCAGLAGLLCAAKDIVNPDGENR